MAKPTCPMRRVRIACINPDLQSVTIFNSCGPTPGRIFLAGDTDCKEQALFIPANSQVGKDRAL